MFASQLYITQPNLQYCYSHIVTIRYQWFLRDFSCRGDLYKWLEYNLIVHILYNETTEMVSNWQQLKSLLQAINIGSIQSLSTSILRFGKNHIILCLHSNLGSVMNYLCCDRGPARPDQTRWPVCTKRLILSAACS